MERFAIPGAGAIIEKTVENEIYILIQDRHKDDNSFECGMIEIPAGKIREFENIFSCLRREVLEETGYQVTEIIGEKESKLVEFNNYKVLTYTPFSCSQNIGDSYPIMVEVFICKVQGMALKESNESKNIRWISLPALSELLRLHPEKFYPMHLMTLQKYLTV